MSETESRAVSITTRLSSYSKLQRLPYKDVLNCFLIERLVARLVSDERVRQSLVFKGGYVGLRVYSSNRFTVDLDALLVTNELEYVLTRARQLASLDLDDAVWFQFEREATIRTQGVDLGVRQKYRSGIGRQPVPISRAQIIDFDISRGDPITPQPVELQMKEMIGDREIGWHVYPIETIIAEKLHALLEYGSESSRSKDIYDLHIFMPRADRKVLLGAMDACFRYRNRAIPTDLPECVRSIDPAMLKLGWPSTVKAISFAPTFEDAFATIVAELEKLFPS